MEVRLPPILLLARYRDSQSPPLVLPDKNAQYNQIEIFEKRTHESCSGVQDLAPHSSIEIHPRFDPILEAGSRPSTKPPFHVGSFINLWQTLLVYQLELRCLRKRDSSQHNTKFGRIVCTRLMLRVPLALGSLQDCYEKYAKNSHIGVFTSVFAVC